MPSKIKRKGVLSQSDKELFSGKTLGEQLPCVFPESEFTINNVSHRCSYCDSPLSLDEIHAQIVQQGHQAHFYFIALCVPCGEMHRGHFIVRDTGEVRWTSEEGIEHKTMTIQKKKRENPLKTVFMKIVGGLF